MATFGVTTCEIIRAGLIEGRWVPGEHLSEIALAEELGIKRGSVREALLQLSAEGFLERRDGAGCQVAAITPEFLLHTIQLRQAIEVTAARLAAAGAGEVQILELDQESQFMERLHAGGHDEDLDESDNRFHRKLVEISNNPVLLDVWNRYHIRALSAKNAFRIGVTVLPKATAEIRCAHRRIVEAIGQRDPEAAESAVREHLSNSLSQMEQHIRKMKGVRK